MYGKPISPHWYFICRSLFQWKHNLSDFMFIYFPHCCEVTVAYLAIFILCQLSGGRKHLYFLRAFSYLTVMMIVLTGSTICGLLSCLTVSEDIMKPSNLWAGLWAEATRGTYKLTSGKYGRGSDCWTICVDSTGVVALWPSQNSYWNIRIFLSLWPRQYRNCGLLLLAADDVKWLQHFSGGQFFRLCFCRKSITIKEAPLHNPQPHTTIRPEICCGWELNFWRKKLANWLHFLQRPQSTGHCLKSKQIENKVTWWM